MARTHARILTSIWSNRDFLALTPGAQRMYLLALSQPGVAPCGVVSFTPKRWATLGNGSTVRTVIKEVEELQSRRFVAVDLDTEELLIRSFAKNDGVLKQPNMRIAMWRSAGEVVSDAIREGFVDGLPDGFTEGLADAFPEGLPEGLKDALSRACARVPPPAPAPSPSSSPDEEERLLRNEAEKRLAARNTSASPVLDREKWLQATIASIREERAQAQRQQLENAKLWGVTLARTGVRGRELLELVRSRYGPDRSRRLATLRACRDTRSKLMTRETA